jgi:hypothetical protein
VNQARKHTKENQIVWKEKQIGVASKEEFLSKNN